MKIGSRKLFCGYVEAFIAKITANLEFNGVVTCPGDVMLLNGCSMFLLGLMSSKHNVVTSMQLEVGKELDDTYVGNER